jgi:TPP-dependent pyruvate/acetoin dehydrogenase alpha subunit
MTHEHMKDQCTVDKLVLERVYRSMYRIRRVEERIADIYSSDKIKSPVHLSIGQEAPSVGLCEALRRKDVVFGTYRGHALYLAKGGDLKAMIAELFGKAAGCGRGKAGSMHLGWRAAGMMGTSAVVATTIPQAVGYAFAEKMRGRDTVVAVCFGDGAMEEGVFHESMNFATLMRLRVIFVCENNFYAIHTPLSKRVLRPNFCERAASYGAKAVSIPNNDVLRTYLSVSEAAMELRSDASGPWFLEIETYRWREHVGPGEDWQLGYRPREEAERWIASDELRRVGAMLEFAARKGLEQEVDAEIENAFQFAEESPFPSAEELFTDVFAP